MTGDRISIRTDSGDEVEAMAPVVISASRSTDIPAFYAKWFFNRLKKGYCVWFNPFNNVPSYVSFARCKVIVFWTKNPAPILPYLHELDERGIHYYFQSTVNDYSAENLEPNVPSVEDRIATFRILSHKIGKNRVIWRFDPLILVPGMQPRDLLNRIQGVGKMLKGLTDKLVFSFVDVNAYGRVQVNLVKETNHFTRENVLSTEMTSEQRSEIVQGIVMMREAWKAEGWPITVATCGEECELGIGIEHNRCIDGDLMAQLFARDKQLLYYLATGKFVDPDIFGGFPDLPRIRKNMKDKGQRKACGCMISKDIGMYNTCRHFCAYCYANTSRACVRRNVQRHSDEGESIV